MKATRTWARDLVAYFALLVGACACAVNGTNSPKTVATDSEPQAVPGIPNAENEHWCDPLPDVDDACTTERKVCAIACDETADTCAMLMCMAGKWEYLESSSKGRQ